MVVSGVNIATRRPPNLENRNFSKVAVLDFIVRFMQPLSIIDKTHRRHSNQQQKIAETYFYYIL